MDLNISQIPCSSLENESLTIQLEKFSFAVTPVGTSSHQWVHDTRKDKLILTFRKTPQSQGNIITNGPLVMSVTVGTEILERQDLNKLATIAESFEGQHRQSSVDRAIEPPVHVVVKLPCVALRYPTSHTLRRRIQMRFKNEADYQRVIGIFVRLKFPMNNAAERDAPIAPIGHPRQASVSPSQKPSHSYGKDISFLSGTLGDTTYAPHKPVLTEESPYFQRPHTASSETMRPTSSLSLANSSAWDTTSSVSVGEPLVRSTSAFSNVGNRSSVLGSDIERQVVPRMLSNSTLSRDQVVNSHLPQFNDRNVLFSKTRTASEAFGPALQKAQVISPNRTWSESAFELGQTGRIASIYGYPSGGVHDINRQTDTRVSLVPDFLRPVSAPVQSNPDSISQWLPPRRELPFPKARLATKSFTTSVDTTSLSTPNSGHCESPAGEPSQLIPPQSATPRFNSNLRRIAQRRTNNTSPVVNDNLSSTLGDGSAESSERAMRSTIFAEREEVVSPLAGKGAPILGSSTSGLPSKATNPVTRKRSILMEPDVAPVSKQARNMVDRATQTQTLSGRDHTAPLTLKNSGGRPPILTTSEAIQPPDSFMNEIESFVSKHKYRSAPQELWQRPGYAEASEEERQAIINDFICENLDNEDFIKLCEDTGNVWRRIGLGM